MPLSLNEIEKIKKTDERYPKLLKEIPDAPDIIYGRGNLNALENICVAIVGTRKFSDYGKAVAVKLGRKLARAGVTIVSGLARGIDALAHEAAIDVGGRTVAVIGSGLDKASLYPREHWRLAEAIVEHGGCVLSEYEPGVGPERHHFPERNRIIAGLSRGVLVIEAPEKSGALITAYQALEYNREVMAVPGKIFDVNAQGTNGLLQRGAALITSLEDVANVLGLKIEKREPQTKPKNLSPVEMKLLNTINQEAKHIDTIITAMELPVAEVAMAIASLELGGLIKDLGGKQYIRVG